MRSVGLILIFISSFSVAFSQFNDTQIKVYDFDEGLSHRNVFKILQDTNGYIWIATINGLNKFDGYKFVQYNTRQTQYHLPFDVISDMIIDDNNVIWLANPDFITSFNPQDNQVLSVKIKKGPVVRMESRVPHSLFLDQAGTIWSATYDEKTGGNIIQTVGEDLYVEDLLTVEGNYTNRPITQWGGNYYIGAYENELWKLNEDGQVIEKIDIATSLSNAGSDRIVQLQVSGDRIWILLINGNLLEFYPRTQTYKIHPVSQFSQKKGLMSTLLVEEDGDIWLGGRGVLLYYNAGSGQVINYDQQINQIIKNTCNYRQIFHDQTGVIWLATDFGLIKLTQSRDLFTKYLDGGNEYCSNVYCSTRGIAEDEDGNIYISYYNSIHVLDPRKNALRLLFPSNDYFNYPFGLVYFDQSLWTGNGKRIDLNTLKIDTIFQKPSLDMGAIIVDKDNEIWFGFQKWLYRYDPKNRVLLPYEDALGRWDSLDGIITHLYQGKTGDFIWVSTLSNGIFKMDKKRGRVGHFYNSPDSKIRLSHNQINVAYEDDRANLWLGTGLGLHKINLNTDSVTVYTSENGLPNDFINGILPESDSVLWISTDYGLCRFSVIREEATNFFVEDGLSSNEFNRISFFKSKDGRMYFGGLNGVNAFYPGLNYLYQRRELNEGKPVFTSFSKFNSSQDSLYVNSNSIRSGDEIVLTHKDKIFTINFALANYQQPLNNEFTYILEGYEKEWSTPSAINSARYNNIPAGRYVFRLKARPERKEWNKEELILYVRVKEALWNTWYFWLLCLGLTTGGVWVFMRYRIYLIEKRELELERQVKLRTEELESEKQKSEELLLNILPAEIADELKKTGVAKAKRHEAVTVMFSDFKSFSKISEQMEPEELVAEIDYCFRAFDKIVDKHGLEKIKTIGDAYLCVGGIAGGGPNDAKKIIDAALEIQSFLRKTAIEKEKINAPYFEARIGIHTGPIVSGIVGIRKFVYDIWGDTVNIASRMETNGQVGKVNISQATYELVSPYFECKPHGVFKEVEKGPIKMYFIEQDV